MSTTTDNKVVEMRFNNQQFEKNANESISTLGKLKEALKFDRSSVKSLDDLQKSTKSFNLDHLTQSVDRASDHFSALGVAGMTVINRLTNAAIDFGKKAVGAMSGGLSGGFAKYSAMTDAVQVMVINSGESIEYVNGLMAELQHYVDDTSYSFEQMTRTMGNFAAVGLDLETAEEMVEGIANWAATAGVNAVKAEAAFREVSNSISNGYLQLRDAQTLMSLNMFTPDFRRLTLATAAAFGTIKEEAGKYWADIGTGAKEKWVEVTESNLTSTLRGKWFTTEVWEEVMHLYAETDGVLSDLDKQLLEAAGLSEEFGLSAFNAAYEAKTFADALGAVRDTISTGWSNTFESIFGNYKEAAWFWTELASYFQEIVGSMADARNELLSIWKEMGGRTRLIRALFESFRVVGDWIQPIAEAFDEVFGSMDPERLYDMTVSLHEFIRSLRPTEAQMLKVKEVFITLFSAVQSLINPIKILLGAFLDISGVVVKFGAGLFALIAHVINLAAESGVFYTIVDNIIGVLQIATVVVLGFIASVINLVKNLYEIGVIPAIIDGVRNAFNLLAGVILGVVYTAITYISQFIAKIKELRDSGINVFLYAFNAILETIVGTLLKIKDAITSVFGFITGKVKELSGVKKSLDNVADSEESLYRATLKNKNTGNIFIDLKNKIIDFASSVPNRLSNVTRSIADFFTNLDKGKVAIAGVAAGLGGLVLKNVFFSGKGKGGIGAAGSIFGPLLDAGSVGKKILIIGALGGAITLLYKKIKDNKDAVAAGEQTASIFDRISNALTSFIDNLKTQFKNFDIVTKIKDGLNSLIDTIDSKLTPATHKIRNFFNELTLGKAVLIAFGLTVAKNLMYFGGTLGAVPFLLTQVTRLLNNINAAVTNWSIWGVDTFGDTCIKIGQSLMYLAGAMWIIAQIPADRFNDVTKAVTGFMAAMLTITSMSTVLALFGKLGNIWDLGLMLLSISASIMILAGAMRIIGDLNDKAIATISILTAVLGVFTLLASLTSKSKTLTLTLESINVSFMGLALSLAILVSSLFLLSKFADSDKLWAAAKSVSLVMGVCGAVIAAVGGFKVLGKAALGTAAALLGVALAFKIIAQTLVFIGNQSLEIMLSIPNIVKLLEIFGVLAASFGVLKIVSAKLGLAAKDAAAIAVAALAISTSMAIISGTLVMLSMVGKYITLGGAGFALATLVTTAVALGIVMLSFSKVGKEAAKASLALLAISGAMVLLVGLGLVLALIPSEEVFYKAIGAMLAVAAFVSAMNYTASKINPGTWAPIMSMAVMIGAMAASLYFLQTQDWKAMATGAAALVTTIGVVTVALIALNKLTKKGSGFGIGATAAAFSIMAVGVIALAGAIKMLEGIEWNSIKAGAITLGVLIAGIAGLGYLIGNNLEVAAGIAVLTGALTVISLIAPSITKAIQAISVAFGALAINLAAAVKIIAGSLSGIIDSLGDFAVKASEAISTVINAISNFVTTVGNYISTIIGAFGDLAIKVATAIGTVIISVAQGVSIIRESLGKLAVDIATFISTIVTAISDGIATIIDAVGGLITGILDSITNFFGTIINAWANLALNVGISISMIVTAIGSLVLAFTEALARLSEMAPQMKETFVSLGEAVGAGLATVVTSFFATLIQQVGAGIAQLLGLIDSKRPEFEASGRGLVDVFGNALVSGFAAKHPIIAGAVIKLADFVKSNGNKKFGEAGTEATKAFSDSMTKASPVATKAATDLGKAWYDEGLAKYLGVGSFGAIDGSHGWGSGAMYPSAVSAIQSMASSTAGSFSSAGGVSGDSWGTGLYNSGMNWASNLYNNALSMLSGLGGMFSGLFGGAVKGSAQVINGQDAEGLWRNTGANKVEGNAYRERKKAQDRIDRDLRAQEAKEQAAYNNALSDALDSEKASIEDYQEMERNRVLRDALGSWDFLNKEAEEAFDAGGSGGSGGGGGGGGASETAKEAEKLFDVWKDGGKIIQKTAETFGEAYEALGFTHPLQLGEAAVQGLAEKLYDLSVAGVDAATLAEVTATEKLAKMKEEFDGFISQIQDSLSNAGDIFGNFALNDSESISKWNSNLSKQETSIDLWVKHIEQLAKRTGDFNLVDQFIKFGPSEDKRLRKILSSSDATIKQLGENMLTYLDADGKKLNDRTARLAAALASTTLEKAKETGDGVSNEASDTANEVTEAAENAANEIDATAKETTQNYVVVNRNGAVSVINEIGKVITANGELGKSAFDAAKVTEEAFGKMEDVYLSAKEAAASAIGESIDLFSKFDTETEIDGEEMRENAKDSLKAWEEMYNGMGTLAEKGLNVDFIIDKLVPMGEQAYGYVKEMLTWTEQDINEWNAMFEKSLSLPDQLVENLGRDLASATLLASQGFISGIGNDATYEAAKKVAIGFVDTMVQQINDPASGAPQMGVAYSEAASKSIEENGSEVTNAAVKALNETVVVSRATAYDGGYDIGEELSRGIAKGISDKIEEVRASIFDLTATTEETAEDEFGIESPSKVFQRIGRFLDLGLAKGIGDNVGFINSASEAMGSSAINSMKAVVGHIADIINGEVQIDPTIRPVVDLSGVEEGAAAVNSMFGGRSYSMTRGIATMGRSDSVNDMISQMMAAQGNAVPVAGGSPINMYVYAAPGQSEEEIANIVEQKLMFRINRQGAAWT